MITLMGQPVETWVHVVETRILERSSADPNDELPLLLAFHEALLKLRKASEQGIVK